MRTLHLTVTAAAVAVIATTAPAAQADNFRPITAYAEFVGTNVGVVCTGSTCDVTAIGTYCEVVGVDSVKSPYAGGCTATLRFTSKIITVGGRVRGCSSVADSGTFTMTYADDIDLTFAADVVNQGAVAHFATDPVVGLGGTTFVGMAEGTLTPACPMLNETAPKVFRGRFKYTRVP